MIPSVRTVLCVDVGGSNVKALLSGEASAGGRVRPEDVRGRDGRRRAGARRGLGVGCRLGRSPGAGARGEVVAEPVNMGKGWAGFDFEAAFGRPTRVVNDAAMQALGSYEGGKMLFLGLGTGLGSALAVDGRVAPMELGHLPYRSGTSRPTSASEPGERGLKRWRFHVEAARERSSPRSSPTTSSSAAATRAS